MHLLGWTEYHTLSNFRHFAASHNFWSVSRQHTCPFKGCFSKFASQAVISLYCESVSWLLLQIPSVSLLVQLGGCGQSDPSWVPFCLGEDWYCPINKGYRNLHMLRPPWSNSIPASKKFLLKFKTIFAFRCKTEALFWNSVALRVVYCLPSKL